MCIYPRSNRNHDGQSNQYGLDLDYDVVVHGVYCVLILLLMIEKKSLLASNSSSSSSSSSRERGKWGPSRVSVVS